MKMTCKKIRNVDKSICTCEQKIAYNYAFMWREALVKIANSGNIAIVKSESKQEIINYVISGIKEKGIDKKYNIDAIIHAFRNGTEAYAKGYSILGSYEEIGRTFPIMYEIA